MRIARAIVLASVLLAVVAAGCEDGADRPTTSSTSRPRTGGIAHPTGARDVVVRVATGGGLVRPETRLGELPELSVYGDGRAIVTGPVIEIYPPPALPNLVEASLDEEQVQRVLRAADDAGLLDGELDSGRPSVTDQPVTTITVHADGEEHVTEVYALGSDGPGLTEAQREARADVEAFVATARELSNGLSIVDPGTDPAPSGYEPEAIAVFRAPHHASVEDTRLVPAPIPWPLDDLASAGTPIDVPGYRCVLVTGAEVDTVLDAAERANTLTPWSSAGRDYSLVLRPLLPDESSCADVV